MTRARAGDDVEAIEVRLLLQAIYERYGYDLRDYAAASMRRRVLAALSVSGLPHLGELQHRILHDQEFFAGVLDRLTVRVTEMFRDPAFFRAFRRELVPILRTYPLVRIWNCGCATGEEVYATAIVLTEEQLYARAQIYGTDLSVQALDAAKEGVYASSRVPTFSANYVAAGGTVELSDYYTEAYEQIAMRDALKRHVLFFPHNLVSDHAFGEMQVVLCRNVLIYFNHELRDRVLDKLADGLCPGGFLCLGGSESLRPDEHPRFVEHSADARIYRRVA